ncbi:uncharacterized protein LOC122670802 [Telopea speciosissima]|uniref:uncharacterized protein LOC122670802 n=1 Tax=Telopea speciosissima TaxID=54955 RepID=UPI001CC64FD6|nr:uncharacterized protein LOC122670802 [Telopea speciosissima]
MASCDDDFNLLSDDNQTTPHPHHHHHQHNLHHPHPSFVPHRFTTAAAKPIPIHPPSHPLNNLRPTNAAGTGGISPKKVAGAAANAAGDEDDTDAYSDAAFCSQADPKCPPPFHDVNPNCFVPEDDPNPFAAEEESDPNKAQPGNVRIDKRKDRDELSDGGTPYSYRKSKAGGGSGSATGTSGGGDYRKDREEWSDSAIGCLLDAYSEKFVQLNRGNLRGRDWEEVSSIVSDRCEKQKSYKSVEQCKNKVDNLKKRYKVERHRMTSGGMTVSHWPWFKKMEQIVGNSASSRALSDEDKSMGASSSMLKQNKRYGISAPSPGSLPNTMKSKSLTNPRWRRVVFKISGAALAGTGPQNIEPKVTMLIAREVAVASRLGVQVAIVVGGRNFFCGDTWVAATGLDRSTAYQIGMMATVMNSILLQSALEKMGVQTRVQTVFQIPEVAEPYSRKRAVRHLEKGRVVIFGGIGAGMGNPLFTTDTAAALRASEINAEAILKGTNVEGVFDSRSNANVNFEHISFREFVTRGVSSMDMMAVTFCEENGIPVVVFNLNEPGNISRALCGDQVGTLIDQAGRIS